MTMKFMYLGGCCALLVCLHHGRVAQAADVNFINGGDFNSAANWDDGNLPGAIPADFHFVQDGLTADFSAGTVTMGPLIVSDSSAGALNMSGGDLTVGGGNDTFAIGRSAGGDGAVTLTGTSILRTDINDSSFVGVRSNGVLDVGSDASVVGNAVWRVGQFGPAAGAGLDGVGLLDVKGTFTGRLIFLGVDDGKGTLRISGDGSVTLTDNLVPNVNTFFPNRSSLVEMIGSSASLTMLNLESANGAGENRNSYLFEADASGVSPITPNDAVNIDNNRLTVDLTSFPLAPNQVLTLFDAAPDRVFGQFGEVNVIGLTADQYKLVYNVPLGDIQLVGVPEPSSVLLLVGMGLAVAAVRRR